MARAKTIPIRKLFCKLFPGARLRELAHESGAVVRERKVDIVDLFWTVVLGFGVGQTRTLAGLRRAYERATRQSLEESSFYGRFTSGFVRLLQGALGLALSAAVQESRALKGPLSAFRDLIITDATVIKVKDLLATSFPACRTNHTKAALKVHTVISVHGAGRQSVKVTSERRHDGAVFRCWPLGVRAVAAL